MTWYSIAHIFLEESFLPSMKEIGDNNINPLYSDDASEQLENNLLEEELHKHNMWKTIKDLQREGLILFWFCIILL